MLAPICVKCRVQMRCHKNNRLVRDAEVGVFPSTYWLGDEWECPGCGLHVVAGFGKSFGADRLTPDDGEALEFRYELPEPEKATAPER